MGLFLKRNECNIVTYSRKHDNVVYISKIADTLIKRTEPIKNLGILFDFKLQLVEHINDMVAKAFATY